MKHEETIKLYHEALADILCWMDGYIAGGGGEHIQRLNVSGLRELKSDLYGKLYGKAPAWLKTDSNDQEGK